MKAGWAIVAVAGLVLAGCERNKLVTGAPVAGGATATAMMRTSAGVEAGRATVTEVANGLRFTVDARNIQPGMHGAHVHMAGRCDAPGFETAGGHWNPTGAKHGLLNPQGPHAGDLPNLVIDASGRGTVAGVVPGMTMAQLQDADGASMMIHAGADDLRTDPSGNSGARVACGVFQAG